MPKSKKSTASPTRRNRYKYSALEKSVNLKSRQSEVDDIREYFNDLPDGMQEVTLADGTKKVMNVKQWMNNFTEEYVHANLDHDGPKLHKNKKDRKIVYNKNNARNRDISTIETAKGMLNHFERLEDMEEVIQENAETEQEEMWYEPKMKL